MTCHIWQIHKWFLEHETQIMIFTFEIYLHCYSNLEQVHEMLISRNTRGIINIPKVTIHILAGPFVSERSPSIRKFLLVFISNLVVYLHWNVHQIKWYWHNEIKIRTVACYRIKQNLSRWLTSNLSVSFLIRCSLDFDSYSSRWLTQNQMPTINPCSLC
jgi:hypothetical protein